MGTHVELDVEVLEVKRVLPDVDANDGTGVRSSSWLAAGVTSRRLVLGFSP